uniref:Uncharacterized protein n=1 Tax=Aegilops tauschii subsp. strangulata TaxID=200361 RepID=A0A453J7J8_AEGTS
SRTPWRPRFSSGRALWRGGGGRSGGMTTNRACRCRRRRCLCRGSWSRGGGSGSSALPLPRGSCSCELSYLVAKAGNAHSE